MKRTIEAHGRSVDEAIFNGLGELGISIDEVSIEIVKSESKGIFGLGAKPAIVRLTEKEPDQIVVPDFEAIARKNAEERRKERESRPRDDSFRDRNGRDSRPRRDDRRQERPRYDKPRTGDKPQGETQSAQQPYAAKDGDSAAPRRRVNDRQRQFTRDEHSPRKELERKVASESVLTAPKLDITYSEEGADADKAAVFLKGLIEHMGVSGKVFVGTAAEEPEQEKAPCVEANAAETDEKPAETDGEDKKKEKTPTKYLRIDSDTMGILIGHRGETLDAIQYLTSLAINKNRREEGYTRVTIDTEGYRDKREETLMRLARKVASQVKATGRSRALEPMNPYERRILHSTLQNNPFVTTHSEGEEPNRRVIVTPKRRGY